MQKLNFEADSLGIVGNRVLDLAERTTTTVNNIEADVENLRAYWQGTTNEALVKNINDEIQNIRHLLENYATAGRNISSIAQSLGDNAQDNANKINAIRY